MNFVSVKKSYYVAFLVSSLVCAQCVMAEFKDEERAYVHQLANEIEQMFEAFKDDVAKFIDATDHTPYKKLVMNMCDKLDTFEKQVVITLAKKLAEAKTKNSAVYQESLTIVHEVLTEFMTRVAVLKNILLKPEYLNTKPNQVSKNGLQLGKEIEKYFQDLIGSKMIEQLEAKIDKVYGLVAGAGDNDLSDRLKTIKGLFPKIFKLQQKKSGGNSAVAYLNALSAHLRHNK